MKIIFYLLFTLSLTLTVYSMWNFDATYDEGQFFKWSNNLYENMTTSRISIFDNSKTPINIVNVVSSKLVSHFYPTKKWKVILFSRRLGNLLWFFLGAFTFFKLCQEFLDTKYSFIASSFYITDPNIITHHATVTSDACFVFATCLYFLFFIKFIKNNSFTNTILLGISLGFLLTSKVTGIVVLFLSLIASLVFIINFNKTKIRNYPPLILKLLLSLLISVIVINSMYFWVDFGVELKNIKFISKYFIFIQNSYPNLALPLPKDFLTMYDMCFHHERTWARNVVIFLNYYPNGIWYYFIVNLILKTPLPFITLFICILSFLAYTVFYKKIKLNLSIESYFITVFYIIIFFYFSFIFRNHKGYRYILMLIPFMYIIVFYISSKINFSKTIIKVFLLLGLIEISIYYNNILAFTNSIIFEKKYAYRYLTDSSIAWNQASHSSYEWVDQNNLSRKIINQNPLKEGYNLIHLNVLTGVLNYNRYKKLRENILPIDHINYTHFLFDLSKIDIELMDHK